VLPMGAAWVSDAAHAVWRSAGQGSQGAGSRSLGRIRQPGSCQAFVLTIKTSRAGLDG